jgi:hypothetical protein
MNNIYYTRVGDLGMNLQFLNGTITVPDEYGAYVVASGCGSGKTTAIKQIIKENYSVGILYSASTIEECNEMYQYCKSLTDEDDPSALHLSDIIVLHSDYKSEGVDNNLWRNNPEDLLNKKVIICTHYKLMSEDPSLLVKTSFNPPEEDFDIYTRSVTYKSTEPLPRRYILIDELPSTGSMNQIVVTKGDFMRLSSRMTEEVMDLIPKDKIGSMRTNELTRVGNTVFIKPESFKSFKGLYDAEKVTDPSFLGKFDHSTKLGEIREGLVMGTIWKKYRPIWSEFSRGAEKIVVSPNFLNIVNKRMLNTVLLFDGTGDLTFYGSKLFTILSTNTVKYNSPITLKKFSFSLKRNQSSSRIKHLDSNLEDAVDTLSKIIELNTRTLVVTWKNLRNSDESTNDLVDSKINESKNFTKLLSSLLGGKGFIEGRDYDIIHYQSGLDKATNKFMESDSIVFLGEFHVPETVISEFNVTFGCETTPEFYSLYQLAQAVSRTRIRLHKGYPINIYYSDDWDDKLMENLVLYFTGKYPNITNMNTEESSDNKLLQVFDPDLKYIKPRFKDDVKKLVESNILPGLGNALSSGTPMKYKVSLEDISKVVERSNYKVIAYAPLVRYLNSLGIMLDITTNSRNKSSKI